MASRQLEFSPWRCYDKKFGKILIRNFNTDTCYEAHLKVIFQNLPDLREVSFTFFFRPDPHPVVRRQAAIQ